MKNVLWEERNQALAERDQLQRDLDRLLGKLDELRVAAEGHACLVRPDRKHLLGDLYDVIAQEIEAGHREKEAPNG
jgi:hypothetical protein